MHEFSALYGIFPPDRKSFLKGLEISASSLSVDPYILAVLESMPPSIVIPSQPDLYIYEHVILWALVINFGWSSLNLSSFKSCLKFDLTVKLVMEVTFMCV